MKYPFTTLGSCGSPLRSLFSRSSSFYTGHRRSSTCSLEQRAQQQRALLGSESLEHTAGIASVPCLAPLSLGSQERRVFARLSQSMHSTFEFNSGWIVELALEFTHKQHFTVLE
jgi:hypothetical protein